MGNFVKVMHILGGNKEAGTEILSSASVPSPSLFPHFFFLFIPSLSLPILSLGACMHILEARLGNIQMIINELFSVVHSIL